MQKNRICCRTSFQEGQNLHQAESKILQYKGYYFPYDHSRQFQLKKAICGMLNTEGGLIIIGVKQTKQKQRIVMNTIYSQDLKQNVLIYFRLLGQSIFPNHLITKQLIQIEFVPIKSAKSKQFIKGGYIIRVRVRRGQRKQIYFFKENNQDYYFMRTKNETIRISTEDIFQQLKSRIQNPNTSPQQSILHKGKCQQVLIGAPQYSKSTISQIFPKNHQKSQKPSFGSKIKNEQIKGSNKPFQEVHKYKQAPGSGSNIKPAKNLQRKISVVKLPYDQLYVLINLPLGDLNKIFTKQISCCQIRAAKVSSIIIISFKAKDLALIKNLLNEYKSKNPKVLLIQSTINLSLQNSDQNQWLNVKQTLRQFTKNNKINGVKVSDQLKMIQFPERDASTTFFMILSDQGIRPRFKN